jgi:hypothetical protein
MTIVNLQRVQINMFTIQMQINILVLYRHSNKLKKENHSSIKYEVDVSHNEPLKTCFE